MLCIHQQLHLGDLEEEAECHTVREFVEGWNYDPDDDKSLRDYLARLIPEIKQDH
ncbi:MAG: hypothetical protein WCK77_10610 [Verrucomicrobiota bacterium]